MGVYYHYVNLSERERFAVDSLGGGSKFSAIGRTLAARAFELMLVRTSAQARSAGLGRWAGDAVAILGDDTEPQWDGICQDFVEIDANAILLVHEFDGFDELGEAAANDAQVFLQLCHLVVSRQAVALEPELKNRFGEKYLRRYKELCLGRPSFKPKNLAPWKS